jgi:hypothetical protein
VRPPEPLRDDQIAYIPPHGLSGAPAEQALGL